MRKATNQIEELRSARDLPTMVWPISQSVADPDLALARFTALVGSFLVTSEGNLINIIEFVDEEPAIACDLLFDNRLCRHLCHLLDRLCCYSWGCLLYSRNPHYIIIDLLVHLSNLLDSANITALTN